MDKNDRLKLQLAVDQADTWAKQYRRVTQTRQQIRLAGAKALKTIKAAILPVEIDNHKFGVLPVGPDITAAFSTLAKYLQMAPISSADQELLHQLDTEIPQAVADATRLLTGRRALGRGGEEADDAAEYLSEYVSWGLGVGITAALDRITPDETAPALIDADLLDPQYGLAKALQSFGTAALVPAAELRSRLATFTAADRYRDLARALTAAHGYVIVCSPPGQSAPDLLTAIEFEN